MRWLRLADAVSLDRDYVASTEVVAGFWTSCEALATDEGPPLFNEQTFTQPQRNLILSTRRPFVCLVMTACFQ